MVNIESIFARPLSVDGNLIHFCGTSNVSNQQQTNEAFSEKWLQVDKDKGTESMHALQKKWYLDLYGFSDESDLGAFLSSKEVVFDAGCGLGNKSAWFAELAPETLVIAMDFSESVIPASLNYSRYQNLFFVRGDIANTGIEPDAIGYVNCDQVIHHTENPEQTFRHLCSIIEPGGHFSCYVYAKKALPRELLDDHFREYAKKLSHPELWEMSQALTRLGRTLSELDIQIDVPEIKPLQIKGGRYDIQRFIYWNFLKCYWNEQVGETVSIATNFDWYAPSNAARFSEEEFRSWIQSNGLIVEHFHREEACYSGRFKKPCVA